jgi:hypothetical protein
MTTTSTSQPWTHEHDRFIRLPILPGSKRPVVRDWPNLSPDSKEISVPFDVFRRAGKQISVGYRLDNLVVIDCDSKDAVAWWWEFDSLVPPTFMSQGRPDRMSHWYRMPPGWEPGTFKPRSDVEVRSGCGAQCLVPPSIHPDTKQPYRWYNDEAPERPSQLPVLPLKVLERLAAERPVRGEREATGAGWDCWPEGERDDWLTRVAGWLKNEGASEEALKRALVALNAALCEPPIPDPERIARSVSRYRDIEWEDEDDTLPGIESLRGLFS